MTRGWAGRIGSLSWPRPSGTALGVTLSSPSWRSMVRAAAAVSVGALVVSPLAIATTATAAVDGSGLVISEVYGGGGNSGAVHTHDFVELHNPTDTAIDLSNLTLPSRSAANTNAAEIGRTHVRTPVTQAHL